MASTTLRLPDELRAEADAYAARLGLSLNALCAVALADYLHARRAVPVVDSPELADVTSGSQARCAAPVRGSAPTSPLPEARALPAAASLPARSRPPERLAYVRPAGGVNAPCPCGSGQKWKRCHGAP